jgi:hypothetical protein
MLREDSQNGLLQILGDGLVGMDRDTTARNDRVHPLEDLAHAITHLVVAGRDRPSAEGLPDGGKLPVNGILVAASNGILGHLLRNFVERLAGVVA